ncbi:hypothetical protein NLU13_4271 [Sarocladium strictum]|uniref:FAD/NAD(P)-binding domain-containing protein n=1 Tax=Sarocladium strictum TaxID=5046 RepID=A0AA39GIK3_SARSR|nr:hypothetical protein NLU13_4271 [Sarocladium strictum]
MYNCIVVGAGWYGLSAAKAYIQFHPDEKVLVVEAESTVGGTWSRDRLYPGLKSNNLWGSYEHPDLRMDGETYGLTEGQHIPAATLHRYLTDFSKKFGIFERTRFDTKVVAIESTPSDTWKVTVTSSKASGPEEVLETEKLIMATGLTSEPNLPTYPGQETFTSQFFHAKDFCAKSETVNTCKRAVIVGAGKSALDCAYAFASNPNSEQVHVIIRPAGDGPVWLAPPYVTPFKRKLEELLHTRAVSWFSPAPWGNEDGYGMVRGFLHGTGLGNLIVTNFFNTISGEVINAHGYNEDPEVFKMKPWYSAFWTGSGIGIHNFDTDIHQLIKDGKIRVHIAEIERLEGDQVHLSNGETVGTDIVLCATGWKKESALKVINFDTGLKQTGAEREKLIKEATQEVLTSFPMLKDQPVLRREQPKGEPLRNYRFIVPSQSVFKRNIAYAGMVSTVATSIFASVQGLWITAFLDGKLERKPANEAAVTKEVMVNTQFGRWRYPCGYGASLPDFAFDSLPYIDLLLNDLGVKAHRKASSIIEMVEPYKPWDYAGVTQEWGEKYAKGE